MVGSGRATMLLAMAMAAACSSDVFFCQEDAQCAGGVCTADGFCGFPDDDCESGIRYGELAGNGLAGTCAPVGGTTSATSGGVEPEATDSAGLTSSTGLALTGDGSSGTTAAADGGSSSSGDGIESTGGIDCNEWWDLDWPNRRVLQLRMPPTGDGLAGFPTPVPLSDDGKIPLANNAGGLRFIGAGCRPLAHEIELDESGTPAVAWVRLPVVGGAPDAVHVYYGNPEASLEPGDGTVWDEDFAGVWHFDGPADATANGNDLTADPPPTTGPLGRAGSFSDLLLSTQATTSLALTNAPAISVTAWVRVDGFAGGMTARIVDKSQSINSAAGIAFSVRTNDNGADLVFDRGLSDTEFSIVTTNEPIGLGAWHHVAVRFDGVDAATLMVNGEVQPTAPLSMAAGSPESDDAIALTIGGAAYSNSRFFDGAIDDVRVSTAARSDAWLEAEYVAGTGQLVVLGPEQSAPGG